MAVAPRITSRQNARVKNAVRLRTGRGRQRQGRFIIDGAREIERAVAAGIRVLEAFHCETLYDRNKSPDVLAALQSAGAEMLPVSPDVFDKICFGERDEIGIVAIAETPTRSLRTLELRSDPLVAVVERIEKPGNLGAIIRCADAAGVDAIVVADGVTELFNPSTIRTSLGTIFTPNVVTATAAEAIAWLKSRELAIVAARPDAETDYTAVDLRGGVAIVLGSEAAGLSRVWRGSGVTAVRLPMLGVADSLNVSTSAAVLFYEALRQRAKQRPLDAAGNED